MEMKCSVCGETLANGEPHCSMHGDDHSVAMTCTGETCRCDCGNTVSAAEIKCDADLWS